MKIDPLEVFASYSHIDEAMHNELAKHLKPLEREGVIRSWHDRKITAGREFGTAIDNVLEKAKIILLLISPDFVASDYCWSREMVRAMERHESGEARVIPVILRPVDWQKTPFATLLALPTDGKPVSSWPNRDDGFLDIAKGIRKVAEEFRAEQADAVQDIRLSIRGCAVTTQYRGAIIEIDLENQSAAPRQITRCALAIPSLDLFLDHSAGPPNLVGGAPWLSRAPFEVPPRRLTRGSLFFSVGPRMGEGLPTEPLPATVSIECYMGPCLEHQIQLYTLDSLRAQEARRVADQQAATRQTPAEKLRAAAEQRQKEHAAQEDAKKRREGFQQTAMQQAPKAFEALAELLRLKGEELNSHNIPDVPILKYVGVNHRLDAGSTYAIELSPYQQMNAYTATVRVGLHPNAAQTHVELPRIKTATLELQASVDEDGFAWIDRTGKKWPPSEIIDVALDNLTHLLVTPPTFDD
jgi:hypothetical protein